LPRSGRHRSEALINRQEDTERQADAEPKREHGPSAALGRGGRDGAKHYSWDFLGGVGNWTYGDERAKLRAITKAMKRAFDIAADEG
jgi:hypothetical protein